MALETDTDIREVQNVQNSHGEAVTAATSEFAHAAAHDLTFGTAGAMTVAATAPDRASTITVHVAGWSGAGHVELRYQDADGDTVTTRGPSENSDYQTDGTTDIFVEAAVASPWLEVAIVDESDVGTANEPSYTIYVR